MPDLTDQQRGRLPPELSPQAYHGGRVEAAKANHYYRRSAHEFFGARPAPWRFGDAGLLLMDAQGRHLAWLGRGAWVDENLRPLLLALPYLATDAAALIDTVDAKDRAEFARAVVRLRDTLKIIEGLTPCPEPNDYQI